MPAGIVYDEHVRVFWLDTDPADLDAPTTGEIGAGEDITGYLVPDGLAFNFGNSRVSGADLLTAFDNESMGRHQAAPALTLKRKLRDGGQVAWDTLGDRLISGCLVVFLDLGPDDTVADGDECVVFPGCETGQPLIQNTAVNTEQRFQVDLAVGEAPHLNAVVGGGS